MENKRGMELAISTIILLVIGVILLVGLIAILFMGWDDFKTSIGAALGSDMAKAQRACRIQCDLDNTVDYCSKVTVGTNTYDNCNDPAIKPKDCSIECKTSGSETGGTVA